MYPSSKILICWQKKNQYQINEKYLLVKTISLHNIFKTISLHNIFKTISLHNICKQRDGVVMGSPQGCVVHTLSGRTGSALVWHSEVAGSRLTQCSKSCDLQPALQCAIRGGQWVLPCVGWGVRPVNWIDRL